MAKWTLSGMLSFPALLLSYAGDKRVERVYGGPPSIFDGGRSKKHYTSETAFSDVSVVADIVRAFNEQHIGCFFTFSAYSLCTADLADRRSNALLEILSADSNNGIILSSDLLLDYVRKQYPALQCTASITKIAIETNNRRDTPDYYLHLLDSFDRVVVNPAHALDPALKVLQQIGHYEQLELLVNSNCYPFCSLAGAHYLNIEKENRAMYLHQAIPLDSTFGCGCPLANAKRPLRFSQMLIQNLTDIGIQHFKLQGRDATIQYYTEELVEYLPRRKEIRHGKD